MWHVSSRSGVATLRTAIHLLLVTVMVITHAQTNYGSRRQAGRRHPPPRTHAQTDGQPENITPSAPFFWTGAGCRRGVVVSGVRRMNEVNARRAQLVLGWVTVFGRVYHLGM